MHLQKNDPYFILLPGTSLGYPRPWMVVCWTDLSIRSNQTVATHATVMNFFLQKDLTHPCFLIFPPVRFFLVSLAFANKVIRRFFAPFLCHADPCRGGASEASLVLLGHPHLNAGAGFTAICFDRAQGFSLCLHHGLVLLYEAS